MGIWKSMSGSITLELTSADIAGAILLFSNAGIVMTNSEPKNDLSIHFNIRRQDLKTVSMLAKKRGDSIRIIGRSGVFWQGITLLHRPVLLAGITLILFLTFYLPTRILYISVAGNRTISTQRILSEAEKSGVKFGALRQEIRSEKMKNELLSAIPQLQWAGVNTKGCTAVISVREKTIPQNAQPHSVVSHLIAARDGIITDCTAENGNPLCKAGQSVRAGEILISGYTDCGRNIRACRAKGEVYALTNRKLNAVTPVEFTQKGHLIDAKEKYALIIGKKRINFYKDSGISGITCDKMYVEYQWTLPGGFALPVSFVVERQVNRSFSSAYLEENAAQQMLQSFARSYLRQQMVAGQILEGKPSVTLAGDCYQLAGTFFCCEMIGREQIVEELD